MCSRAGQGGGGPQNEECPGHHEEAGGQVREPSNIWGRDGEGRGREGRGREGRGRNK